jgi:2-keto-4-pentenoate hydratase/2-oxohepta-3-ene-1,7-dioic acid hydratase in catechol pathway
MKLASIHYQGRPTVAVLLPSGRLLDLPAADPELPARMELLIADWPRCEPRVRALLHEPPAAHTLAESAVQFEPVVSQPEKILCVGLNYHDHAREANMPVPESPTVFAKYNNVLLGHGQPVQVPSTITQTDYEAELAFIIGRLGKGISAAQAYDHVFGYTVFNDVTDREAQFRVNQWTLGKSPDTFGPLGPYLVTRDEVPDPHALAIELRVNGELLQASRTEQLIFSVPALVEHLSRYLTLRPGDVVATGTPAGVGYVRQPPLYLRPDDVVEVQIESVGTLRNPIATAETR